MNILDIEIRDPIEEHSQGAIEVNIVTSDGKRRWCFFFTPEGLAACGDWIEGTTVRIHLGVLHMIVVSEISESIIKAALQDIENLGELELRTLPYKI